MPTLLEQLENNLGSCMSGNLYFDFGYIESAVYFLKNSRGHTPTPKCKEILDQFINNHITNQNYTVKNPDGTYTSYPLGGDIEYCFNAWWKGQPSPRCLAQQKAAYKRREQQNNGNRYAVPPLGSWHDVVVRVKDYQSEQEMYRQMYANDDELGPSSKTENTPLIDKLLGKPEDMCYTFLSMFRNVASAQTDSVLEANGVLDKYDKARISKYLNEMYKDPNAITALTDNDLPLQMDDVADWAHDRLKGAAVYMQDSNEWYYLRGNKYDTTPDYQQGNPLARVLKDFCNLCNQYASSYPIFSRTIAQSKRELLKQLPALKKLIGTVETHTEEEFNNNVLTVGNFCTPHGLYKHTKKISESNGLTKVCTNSNILGQLTDKELDISRGVQLFKNFMRGILPDDEIRKYFIGVLANAITGHRDGEYIYILHGATGSNGKSVLRSLLQNILGDYYSDYNTDCLVRNAGGKARLDARDLEGRRVVFGNELGDGSTIDGGTLKRYFSNDNYTIELKYGNPYTVKPTHTMFLPVNQMPNFGSDPAVRRRLIVIPFTEHFVTNPNPKNPHEHKLDPNTLNNLLAHKDEIFTYLVRYAEQLREENITLTVPATVQHYGDEMVDESDVFADFVASGIALTEEQMNDPNIPMPRMTSDEFFVLWQAFCPNNAYNPYKTKRAARTALLLKCPQLKIKKAYSTDKKQIRGVICGFWMDPNSAAAKLVKSRYWDKDLNAPSPFPQFKETYEFEDWLNNNNMQEDINQVEQYANAEHENQATEQQDATPEDFKTPQRTTTEYKIDSLTNTSTPQYEYWRIPQAIKAIGQQFTQNSIEDIVKNMDDVARQF